MLLIPVKAPPKAWSEASVLLSPIKADWTDDEYIWSFWRTRMMPFPPLLLAEGNCALMMFCASCDSAFDGPPKLEPATL